ncbi:MAG TPA: D-aminoacyl-tRNA deacylase [Candidatus Saccharicenans sp.]|nr:D-aminoacyl-tRNA deacylase [Candidatus Saccharicenans sp.]HOL45978.1 D-aminoacyl-tRNA deacylase [Candidatus Saccharicenans sp.]HOM94837.1 D-aminoacyl-tRNA deacylase [Candidatus Saccharicenans sp.]HOT69610.1 D-aminoacyl-tRNA deacylase [Candidatus Saccharicenans sp.]HPU92660.1 D-aminoacyl-tRNA deacylase [Candidatus Saccharicenans sp.]
MKIVLQRVKKAKVLVEGKTTGEIGAGVCLLVGIEKGDREVEADYLADKVIGLRIFPDEQGRMNLSLLETGGSILAVSQFTLAASIKKGRRPSFDQAESPEQAARLFNYFVERLEVSGLKVETGVFQAMMDVYLINDGPVTFILDSKIKHL